jgi:hypothetical protein
VGHLLEKLKISANSRKSASKLKDTAQEKRLFIPGIDLTVMIYPEVCLLPKK